jgi:ATP-dependent exoDNAse (exonuclease V) beta subunit
MTDSAPRHLPPDQMAREQALDASSSILVQAPAGSGKTDLLTRRFLRLLAEVDEPGQVLAITFTKAAAAEMRHRILSELEKASLAESAANEGAPDEYSMEGLAACALSHSQALQWNLIELPTQLRIMTIDAFCRELALQQPLLSGLGSGLDVSNHPEALYRSAARRTLEHIDSPDAELCGAIEKLLLLRDNNWQEIEKLLATMLAERDKWMRDFVFLPRQGWDALREQLERPFARAVRESLVDLCAKLDLVPHARAEAHALARFACAQTEGKKHRLLAEMTAFPVQPLIGNQELEIAMMAYAALAELLLTKDGSYFEKVDKRHGFPADRKEEKVRHTGLIQDLKSVSGFETALAGIRDLPPLRYSDADWRIVRASFTLLRRAAAELKVVFAEVGAVDFIEVAQIAESVLRGADGNPTEGALAAAEEIRHLLVDEFQDTSRKQHELLRRLIAAWPEREGRTCFVVGDPMQSIYSFRDADVELFSRVKEIGLEIPEDQPLILNPVSLTANFRAAAPLVDCLNEAFGLAFEADDGSGVAFTEAVPARDVQPGLHLAEKQRPRLQLHTQFMPRARQGGDSATQGNPAQAPEDAFAEEGEIIELIRTHQPRMEAARAEGRNYRIAILGRARTAIVPVAQMLHAAQISFSAIELEKLKERPEILDALSLLRALLNPFDRVAWLGVLRAPWCGLSLADLHTVVGGDNPELLSRPVPDLLQERAPLVAHESTRAIRRVMHGMESAAAQRAAYPARALGTWLEQAWSELGGVDCVDRTARANLDRLWSCLDGLPDGERDALGPALDAALDKLTASPDPNADAECGVQLMTIHKAKGLEFEVVLVPELQARSNRTKGGLLSWLERGVSGRGDSGGAISDAGDVDEITEFLIAPLASKGADSGAARKWVDRVRALREEQEMRRIFYVVATRAREELHLFACLTYKTEADGTLALMEPKNSLLATAWHALQQEAQQQFDAWKATVEPGNIDSVAASGTDTLIEMASVIKPTLLHRLPADYESAQQGTEATPAPAPISGAGQLYERHEGGRLSRALGTAVHAVLQQLARLRETGDWDEARSALKKTQSPVASQIREQGIDITQARKIARQAIEIVLNASRDALGQWILSPHKEAASEARWAGIVSGTLRTVQVDRLFQAGPAPLSESANESADTWWVVDYKTAFSDNGDLDAALTDLRKLFSPQVEAYARLLRNLRGAEANVHCGLYYPRMMKFDWWEV